MVCPSFLLQSGGPGLTPGLSGIEAQVLLTETAPLANRNSKTVVLKLRSANRAEKVSAVVLGQSGAG